MTYQNGSHGCLRTAQLVRIESELAKSEADRREHHEKTREVLGKLQADLASFQTNTHEELSAFTKITSAELTTIRQDFDRRFRAVFSRLDALAHLVSG